MSEKAQLYDVPFTVRTHVKSLRPLVERLYADSPGFVETVAGAGANDRLTEHGRASISAAHQVALESCAHLKSIAGHHPSPTPHYALLNDLSWDAAKLFGVLSAALGGLAEHPDPCLAAWGMKSLLDELEERSRSDEVEGAADFVLRHPAETVDQTAELVERAEEEEARERMAAGGGDKRSGRAESPTPVEDTGRARDRAAETAGVSSRKMGDEGLDRRDACDALCAILDLLRPISAMATPFLSEYWGTVNAGVDAAVYHAPRRSELTGGGALLASAIAGAAAEAVESMEKARDRIRVAETERAYIVARDRFDLVRWGFDQLCQDADGDDNGGIAEELVKMLRVEVIGALEVAEAALEVASHA